MKICSICAETKVESEYYFKDQHSNKLHSQCKQCYIDKRRKTYKEHYHKYGSEYRERAKLRNKRLKMALRIKMVDYLPTSLV